MIQNWILRHQRLTQRTSRDGLIAQVRGSYGIRCSQETNHWQSTWRQGQSQTSTRITKPRATCLVPWRSRIFETYWILCKPDVTISVFLCSTETLRAQDSGTALFFLYTRSNGKIFSNFEAAHCIWATFNFQLSLFLCYEYLMDLDQGLPTCSGRFAQITWAKVHAMWDNSLPSWGIESIYQINTMIVAFAGHFRS